MTIEAWTGKLPEGWSGGEVTSKWWRGKIVALYKLHRPCSQCKREMTIDVTKAALEGTAKNAGLHLKRCGICRTESRMQGASSRPRVEGEAEITHAMQTKEILELNQLRTANITMKEELEGLYAQIRGLREQLEKYELGPAMRSVANTPAQQKMPWES